MVRLVLALALLGGCDIVLNLHREIPESACGKFLPPTDVAFDPALAKVRDFSFNGDETRGFALATRDKDGLTPLAFDGETWAYDPTYEANLASLQANDRVHYGRISRDNELFVSQILNNKYAVYHYEFRTDLMPPTWVLKNNFPVSFTNDAQSYPGGELSLPAGPGETLDYLPIIRFNDDASYDLAIAQRMTGSQDWIDAVSGGRLTTYPINDAGLAVTHAVLALGPPDPGTNVRKQVLIYAARPEGNDAGSDLYLSEKDGNTFPVGTPLKAINQPDTEEVDPWIDLDCSMLYFRRTTPDKPDGGTIHRSVIEPRP